MMKLKDLKNSEKIRELTVDALETESREVTEHLMKLRFQLTSGQIEDPNIITAYRRGLARVKTVLAEKQKAAESKS